METIAVPFETDAADRLKRAAAEDGLPVQEFIVLVTDQAIREREALTAVPTAQEEAAMARAVADIAAGRLSDHDDVFARLDAKHGWQ